MGASLFTNASAQTALQTLSAASKSLAATQNRVSTGYRIDKAEDNAAYWSIATTLRSDVKALNAVSDALGLGAATIDTVYTGINDTKDLLDQIKSKLVTASQSGVPRQQVQAEVSQLQNRLKDVSKSTVINGESWLTQDSSVAGYNNVKTVVGSFTRSGGVVTIDTINVDIAGTKLYENSGVVNSNVKADASTLVKTYADTVAASANSTASAATGLTQARVDEIKNLLDDANWETKLIDTLTTAITTGATAFNIGANTVADWNNGGTVGDEAITATWRAGLSENAVRGIIDAAVEGIDTSTSDGVKLRDAARDMLNTNGYTAVLGAMDTALNAYASGADAAGADLAGGGAAGTDALAGKNSTLTDAVKSALTTLFDRSTLTAGTTAPTNGLKAADVADIRAVSDANWTKASTAFYEAVDSSTAVATAGAASGAVTTVVGGLDAALTAAVTAAKGANTDAGNNIEKLLGTDGLKALKASIKAELDALGTVGTTAGGAGDDTDAVITTAGTGRLANLSATATAHGDDVRKVVAESNEKIYKLVTDALDRSRISGTATAGKAARDQFETAMKANENNQKLGIFDKVRTVVSKADGTGAQAISVSNIDISKLTDTDFDREVLTSYISAVDDALQELTLSASVVGAAKSRIEGNKTFVKNLIDANNRGIGQLVDADLNEESAKLKALQTQEQLAIQALGIANSSSQNILRLFQ